MATADPLPRLAATLRDLGDQIHAISDELRSLQPTGPAPQATTPATPAPTTPVPPMPAPVPQPVPPPAAPPPTYPAWPQLPPSASSGPGLWERVTRDGAGSRLLAWAGGVVTLAGVVLLLVLAIQRGFLGPLPRVLLGAALGVTLAGIGMWLRPNPHSRTGAFALAATGFAVLYLDVVAATALFGFLPPAAGLGAGLAVAGLGLLLAVRWDAQPFAVFVVVCCALSAPFVSEGFGPLLLGFLLVLEIGATPAQLVKRWGGLCLAAGIPPVLAALTGILVAEDIGADTAAVAYLGLLTSAAQVVVATVSALRRPGDPLPVGLLLLAPAPAMLAATLVPQAGAVALPGTIGALLVLVWALGRLTGIAPPRRFGLAAGAGGSVALLQATVTALDGSVLAIVLLAEALLLTLVARRLRYPAALGAAVLFGLVGLMTTAATALPGTLIATPPADVVPAAAAITAGLTGLLLAVTMLTLGHVATRLEVLTGDGARPAWLLGGLVALYGATGAVLSVGLLISPDRSGFLLGHVLVTVSWTVGALVLLLRGIDSAALRVAGLSLVGAALVKLVLFDLSSLDGLARVAAFLVAGLVLLGAGTRYAKLVAARTPYSPRT